MRWLTWGLILQVHNEWISFLSLAVTLFLFLKNTEGYGGRGGVFTRPLLPEGSRLQVEILFVCTSVITSTFAFYGLQIIPESCQTPHIIYRWIWCMSGGIRSMSGGVWWCLMHVWWCPAVSMYIDRFELIDVYGQISLPLMLLKC